MCWVGEMQGEVDVRVEAEEDMEEGQGEESAVECLREWVGWHKLRVMTVDLLAWGAFGLGIVGALGEVVGRDG